MLINDSPPSLGSGGGRTKGGKRQVSPHAHIIPHSQSRCWTPIIHFPYDSAPKWTVFLRFPYVSCRGVRSLLFPACYATLQATAQSEWGGSRVLSSAVHCGRLRPHWCECLTKDASCVIIHEQQHCTAKRQLLFALLLLPAKVAGISSLHYSAARGPLPDLPPMYHSAGLEESPFRAGGLRGGTRSTIYSTSHFSVFLRVDLGGSVGACR